MKVLHIGKYYPPHFGGIERVNYDLVEGLNQNGIRTDVLCFNDKSGNLYEEDKYKIYRASSLLKLKSTPFSVSLFFILKKIYSDYDIIHLHLPNPTAAIALQLVPFKGKIILLWHSDIIRQVYLKKIYGPFQKALLKRADHIIVTSSPYLDGSPDLKEFKSKCKVIPIGINEPEPANSDRLNLLKKTYPDKKIIFSIGRLIYYKGFEYLIEAAKELPDDYLVLIGGDGELYHSLNNQITRNTLDEKVKLLGKIKADDISAYFELCDVFCMPSCERSEAFGIVQVEAMSFSKPVISTNIPFSGVPWINDDQVTGLIVMPKNPGALSKAIKTILSNQELAEKYGQNARKKYLENFTSVKMVQQTIELYNSY